MEQVQTLAPVVLLLLIGIVANMVMRPIGLSPIVGYLIAGLAIGPHGFSLVQETATTHLLAELGIVFLLFDIGLHFSLPSIWEARRDILGLGPVQILLCGLAFGAIAWGLGFGTEHALLFGGALALSSTAVVVQVLAENRQRSCPVGTTGIAVLVFQDICAIFLLILAASLDGADTSAGGPALAAAVGLALLKAAGTFLAAVLIGRYAINPLFRFLAQSGNEEVFTATALLVVLASAAVSGGAGLSLTLGAFLGGMMMSETPYRHVIQTEARPFRDLLLAFFFITVGMSLDWRVVLGDWTAILVFLVALIAIKTLLVILAARAFGWSTPGAVQLGFLLAQGSEFVFVIAAMPAVRQALGESLAGVVITGVAISLALTPTLAAQGNRLARSLRRRSAVATPAAEKVSRAPTKPVIVFGLGEVGRCVVDALEANHVAYDAVEMDYDRFLAASADGYPVAFGDVGDVRLMETLAMGERDAVVVTIVRYELSQALTPIMRDRYPNLIRFIAVNNDDDRASFETIGMRPVVSRSVPLGLELAAEVLRSQRVPESKIRAWMERQQERALEASAVRGVATAS